MPQAVIQVLVALAAELPQLIETIQVIVAEWHNNNLDAVAELAKVLPTAAEETVLAEAAIAKQRAQAYPGGVPA